MNVYDIDGTNAKTNSPAGEFNVLYATSSAGSGRANNRPCGLIFYQAGIAVVTSSVFKADFVEELSDECFWAKRRRPSCLWFNKWLC